MACYEFESKIPRVHPDAFVHPQAVLIGNILIDAECYIGACAVLRGDIGFIQVGRGSNVQENCVVHTFPDTGTIIHPNAHIGHGCILHGCEICSNVLVGMRSIVADGVKINSYCLVGAGSFIEFGTKIPAGSVVVGSPAKIIKAVEPEHRKSITEGLGIYQELTRRYLKSFKETSQ